MRKNFRVEPIEEALYEQAASEIAAGQIRQGLWLKATVESEGDDFKARAIYTRYRVELLKEELEEALAAESMKKAHAEENLRRVKQEEAAIQRKIKAEQWREKNFKRLEYTPQDIAKLKRQNTVALVIIAIIFLLSILIGVLK